MSFPAGARDDSRAPYNQSDSNRRHCENCDGTGWVPANEFDDDDAEVQCPDCEGSGYVEAERPEREYEAEDYYDRYEYE